MGGVMHRLGAAWRSVAPRGRAARMAWIALALGLVWSGFEGALLRRTQQLNRQIAAGTPPPDSASAPAEVRFAHAHALAASGAFDAALNRYGHLQDASPLGQAARYNSANLLLRQGMAHRAAGQDGQALALIELAKEGYRELLRANPMDWPARYNLERAQRLVPDPLEADDAPPDVNRAAERAATTMRGYSPGLP
jgi:mxaK protein